MMKVSYYKKEAVIISEYQDGSKSEIKIETGNCETNGVVVYVQEGNGDDLCFTREEWLLVRDKINEFLEVEPHETPSS